MRGTSCSRRRGADGASSDDVIDGTAVREGPGDRAEVLRRLRAGALELALVDLGSDVIRHPQPLHPLVVLEALDVRGERRHRVALLPHQLDDVDGAAAPEGGEQHLERRQAALTVQVDRDLRAVAVRDHDGSVLVRGEAQPSVRVHAPEATDPWPRAADILRAMDEAGGT